MGAWLGLFKFKGFGLLGVLSLGLVGWLRGPKAPQIPKVVFGPPNRRSELLHPPTSAQTAMVVNTMR